MILNNRKVEALLKENSELKSENSKLQKTTSNFEIVNTKLENENQEFFKRANDLENKLRKLGQTSQTINMLPTKMRKFINKHLELVLKIVLSWVMETMFFKQSAKADTYFV